MKSIQLAALLLIVMNMMTSCTKNNWVPTATAPDTFLPSEKTGNGPISKFITPENFVAGITNPYFPLTPGDTFYYKTVGVDKGDSVFEDVTIAVTSDTKMIQGITCMVVHDQVKTNNIVTEDTYDWFAQDIYGTVWYFGEDTKSLQEDGSWSTEGSFESGVDGALAGFIMPAKPEKAIGDTYRQEFSTGQAEDKATILSTNETVTIGLGTYTKCVETVETTVLDPGVKENKWYAPGIGEIKASFTIGGDEQEELIGKN